MSTSDVRDLLPQDAKRIRCMLCAGAAEICETVHWDTGNTKGVSFFYLCRICHDANNARVARRFLTLDNGQLLKT